MDFSWTTDQHALHLSMRELGAQVATAPEPERLGVLASGGALGLCIDRDHGGAGESLLTTAYAYEGLGMTLDDGGLLLAAGAHLFGVAMTIQHAGTDAQKAKWLPLMVNGWRVGTVATTEAGAGSDVSAVSATVNKRGEDFVAKGYKRYVTYADRAGVFLFVGRADGRRGLTTALVEAGEGVSVEAPLDTIGLHGARLAPVMFDDRAVPADNILGRAGAGMAVFQIAMTYERALVLAFRLGAMQRQLDDTIQFVRRRKLGKGALTDHQAVTHRIARMKMRLESARMGVYRAAWLLDEGQRGIAEAALVKWQLAEAAVENAMDAMRLRGGAGYIANAGLGSTLNDTLGGAIHSGTGDVLANIVAGWLGV